MRNLLIVLIIAVVGYFMYQQVFNTPSYSDEVLAFVANNCPPCNDAAALLDKHEIEYTQYNVNDSDENYKLFKKHKGHKLPLVIIGNERVEGYDETILQIAINGFSGYDGEDIEVVMYTKPGCGWCDRARQFFQKNTIEFKEYDINVSYENKQAFDNLGGQGTPLIFVGNNKISGFHEQAVKMALRQVGMM